MTEEIKLKELRDMWREDIEKYANYEKAQRRAEKAEAELAKRKAEEEEE